MNDILKVNTGDIVEFKFKGCDITGTITRIRTKTNRKLKRLLSQYHIDDPFDTETVVAEITVIGKGIYTVPMHSISRIVTPFKPADKASEAMQYARDLKYNHYKNKCEKKNSNYDIIEQHGLLNLKSGDKCWVKYRGGSILERTFLSFSPSYQIKIMDIYRERFIDPNNVFTSQERARL